MTNLAIKYNDAIYTSIDISPSGIKLETAQGQVEIVPVNLREPNTLYKLQDIEKAVKLYKAAYPTELFPLNSMLITKEMNYLFANVNGKVSYAKSTLHSSFGKYNRSLFSNVDGVIFIVKDTKTIIACIRGHYTKVVEKGKIQKNLRSKMSGADYALFKQLCENLKKAEKVTDILTKIM